MPYNGEHSCRLKDPSVLKDATRVVRIKHTDGTVLITGFWGPKGNVKKVVVQAKRYLTSKWSKEKAQKDCRRLKGKFEPAKAGT